MNNYKIKVNNEAESKEAQDLFEQLGFTWAGDYPENGDWYSHLYAENSNCCYLSPYVWDGLVDRFKEITLPQLRDLVVLHRNDVNDATHKYIGGGAAYKTVDDIAYLWTRMGWEYKGVAHDLVPLHKEDEQGLISGNDAKLAWAKGGALQINKKDTHFGFIDMSNDYSLGIFDNEDYEFRLKPRTITLNGIEIPCCGTNYKQGQLIWILNSLEPTEYCSIILDESDELPAYWWSTEEEIKQVVAALRGGIKG